jgi:hypothetical protein
VLKDIEKLESKKGKNKQEKIEKKLKALGKAINTSAWHISGIIKIREDIIKQVKNRKRIYVYNTNKKEMESFIKVLKMKRLELFEVV